jgi:hypothetical protein
MVLAINERSLELKDRIQYIQNLGSEECYSNYRQALTLPKSNFGFDRELLLG